MSGGAQELQQSTPPGRHTHCDCCQKAAMGLDRLAHGKIQSVTSGNTMSSASHRGRGQREGEPETEMQYWINREGLRMAGIYTDLEALLLLGHRSPFFLLLCVCVCVCSVLGVECSFTLLLLLLQPNRASLIHPLQGLLLPGVSLSCQAVCCFAGSDTNNNEMHLFPFCHLCLELVKSKVAVDV